MIRPCHWQIVTLSCSWTLVVTSDLAYICLKIWVLFYHFTILLSKLLLHFSPLLSSQTEIKLVWSTSVRSRYFVLYLFSIICQNPRQIDQSQFLRESWRPGWRMLMIDNQQAHYTIFLQNITKYLFLHIFTSRCCIRIKIFYNCTFR